MELLTKRELHEIDSATFEILQRVGIIIRHSEALKLLDKVGAEVNYKEMTAKIPEYLVKDALKYAPNRFKLVGRNKKHILKVEKGCTYFSTGDALNITDLNGQTRTSTKKDAENFTRLADALEKVHFVYIINVGDVPSAVSDRYRYFVGFNNTSKPITGVIQNAEGAKDIVEMASVIAGGKEGLRKRPPFFYGYNATSPLNWGANAIDVFKVLATNSIPVSVQSSPMSGGTAPVTLAGTVVLFNAEILSGILITQLFKKGAPCIYCAGFSYVMDMKTGEAMTGSPEVGLLSAAGAQLAKHYDLPSMSWIRSDSKVSDAQAGYEKALLAILQVASGNNLIWCIGSTDFEMTVSYEQAIIDNEILEMVCRANRGIETTDETLALAAIERVGFGGNFLGDPHTLRHYKKECVNAKITDKWSREIWEKRGARSVAERAREKAKIILKDHRPEPLPKDVKKKLWNIVKRAEKDLRLAP